MQDTYNDDVIAYAGYFARRVIPRQIVYIGFYGAGNKTRAYWKPKPDAAIPDKEYLSLSEICALPFFPSAIARGLVEINQMVRAPFLTAKMAQALAAAGSGESPNNQLAARLLIELTAKPTESE